jgi:SAM-dependent methyltransferase
VNVILDPAIEHRQLEHKWRLMTDVPRGYEVDRELIGKRFDLYRRHAVLSLNLTQKKALSEFLRRLLFGDYRIVWHACVCGCRKFKTISDYDRYGIPMNTVLCNRCGQMQANPYLDTGSAASFYRQYYRAIYSGSYEPQASHFEEQVRQGLRIKNFFGSHGFIAGTKIFEIGCGAGGILHTFGPSRHELYGCDYNNTYLESGRSHGLRLYAGDADVLLPHGKADLIILSHVVEHFQDPIKELGKISRLISDAGYLYVEVPNVEKLNSFYRSDILRFFQNAHNWCFTQNSLDRLMASCGYFRVFGNHKIRAVYQKGKSRSIPAVEGEAQRQLMMCRQHERRRPMLSPIIRLINVLASIRRTAPKSYAAV